MNIVTRGKAALRKNYPDLKAVLIGKYPGFVYHGRNTTLGRADIPVFHFHEVTSKTFEEQLIWLKENQYETLDTNDWRSESENPGPRKKVLLTFDDGEITLYRNAFPMLRKHGCKVVSFICPALVPPESADAATERDRYLCNWAEIREMHETGLVDFQCHSLRHDLVFSSDKLEGFLSPDFQSHYFGKRGNAVVFEDEQDMSLTCLCPYDEPPVSYWGSPIFALRPRLDTNRRFICDQQVHFHMRRLVQDNGGAEFFEQKDWSDRLNRELSELRKNGLGRYVDADDYQKVVAQDLESAKAIIEENIPGKKVEYLCLPWFVGTDEVLRTASSVGYLAAFLGGDVETSALSSQAKWNDGFMKIQRIPNSYIFRLPGRGRKGLTRVVMDHHA